MTLSKEELRSIIDSDHVQCGDAAAMARELLERRERDGQEPVGYTYNRGINCEIVAADLNAYCPCGIDLYAAPPAPVVQPVQVPAIPDAATAIRACMEEFPESVHDIVEECAAIAENACRVAMLKENKK